jgi:hypothetical protein
MRTNDAAAIRLQAVNRELQSERALRLKTQAQLAGAKSANQRLRVAVLAARAENEQLKLKAEKPSSPSAC